MEVKMHNVVSVKETIGHHKLGDERFVTRKIKVINEDGAELEFTIFGKKESDILTSAIEVNHHD